MISFPFLKTSTRPWRKGIGGLIRDTGVVMATTSFTNRSHIHHSDAVITCTKVKPHRYTWVPAIHVHLSVVYSWYCMEAIKQMGLWLRWKNWTIGNLLSECLNASMIRHVLSLCWVNARNTQVYVSVLAQFYALVCMCVLQEGQVCIKSIIEPS